MVLLLLLLLRGPRRRRWRSGQWLRPPGRWLTSRRVCPLRFDRAIASSLSTFHPGILLTFLFHASLYIFSLRKAGDAAQAERDAASAVAFDRDWGLAYSLLATATEAVGLLPPPKGGHLDLDQLASVPPGIAAVVLRPQGTADLYTVDGELVRVGVASAAAVHARRAFELKPGSRHFAGELKRLVRRPARRRGGAIPRAERSISMTPASNPCSLPPSRIHAPPFTIHVDIARQARRLPEAEWRPLMERGAAAHLEWLREAKRRSAPEFAQHRPPYYYYYEWMRARLAERFPGRAQLPGPVVDKLLEMDSAELDLLLQYPVAIAAQAAELTSVLVASGPLGLQQHKVAMLSWEEVKALKGPGTVGLGLGYGAPGEGFLPAVPDTNHALQGHGAGGGLTRAEALGLPAPIGLPPDHARDVESLEAAGERERGARAEGRARQQLLLRRRRQEAGDPIGPEEEEVEEVEGLGGPERERRLAALPPPSQSPPSQSSRQRVILGASAAAAEAEDAAAAAARATRAARPRADVDRMLLSDGGEGAPVRDASGEAITDHVHSMIEALDLEALD